MMMMTVAIPIAMTVAITIARITVDILKRIENILQREFDLSDIEKSFIHTRNLHRRDSLQTRLHKGSHYYNEMNEIINLTSN